MKKIVEMTREELKAGAYKRAKVSKLGEKNVSRDVETLAEILKKII